MSNPNERVLRAEITASDPKADALIHAHEMADYAAQDLAEELNQIYADLPKSARECLEESLDYWREKQAAWRAASQAFLS